MDYTKILSKHKVILFHGIRPIDSGENTLSQKVEWILEKEKGYSFLPSSTIGYGDKRVYKGRVNYWSSLGIIIEPKEILFASPEDVGSMSPEINPTQLQHYLNNGLGPENLENSIDHRDQDHWNEIGVKGYKVYGWFIDLNPKITVLDADVGTTNLEEIAKALSIQDWPTYAWRLDQLMPIALESQSFGQEIRLEDFYQASS